MSSTMSQFSNTIMLQKYSQTLKDGTKETWENIAYRVTKHVMKSVGYSMKDQLSKDIFEAIKDRKFIPGGRYLYSAGRNYHQTQNCFSGDTKFITNKGIFTLEEKVGQQVEIRNKYGIWEIGIVQCFGEQELFKLTLNNGDEILTTENHLWWQSDNTRIPTNELEEVMLGRVENLPLCDKEAIRHGIIFGDGHVIRHKDTKEPKYSQIIFVNPEKDQSLVKFFENKEKEIIVGFGAKLKVQTIRETKRGTIVSLQPKHYKQLPDFKTLTPEYARGFIAGLIATDGCVSKHGSVMLSCEGFEKAKLIREIAVLAGCVVSSVRISNKINPYNDEPREMSTIFIKPASAPIILPSHKNNVEGRKLVYRNMTLEVNSLESTNRHELVYCLVVPDTESFTLANGIITSNCLLLKAEDSREGWADLLHKATMALMTGAGIGVVYSDIRAEGRVIRRTGGHSTGPLALMQMLNEAGRGIMQGGSRRSAIWAGLHWNHGDIHKFIHMKDWSADVRALKEKDFNFPATLDGTNISVILDDDFFKAYDDQKNPQHSMAQNIYWETIRSMLKTGEPGFSIDVGVNNGENLRNACTEVTSRDDSDICNLGSINLANISDLGEMGRLVELGSAFLLAGTVYSDVPYAQVDKVRTKNRRLGLGLMGLHEWLLKNGKQYGSDSELQKYLEVYQTSGQIANKYAKEWELSKPIKTRAIAPTGSISIISETSSGIEPIFCSAYKRRYLKHTVWQYQYVVDPIVKRLVESGTNPNLIEDAYSIDFDRRLEFQSWVQKYVDQSISSTVNLPNWGSEANNEGTVRDYGNKMMKHLPNLRGLTVYPDGSRAGQPLTPIPYEEAINQLGEVFVEQADLCDITKAGSCGS